MKHLDWAMLSLIIWGIYFQLFVFVAIKRLITALTFQTICSVLLTLMLSIILITTLILLIIRNEGEDKK